MAIPLPDPAPDPLRYRLGSVLPLKATNASGATMKMASS